MYLSLYMKVNCNSLPKRQLVFPNISNQTSVKPTQLHLLLPKPLPKSPKTLYVLFPWQLSSSSAKCGMTWFSRCSMKRTGNKPFLRRRCDSALKQPNITKDCNDWYTPLPLHAWWKWGVLVFATMHKPYGVWSSGFLSALIAMDQVYLSRVFAHLRIENIHHFNYSKQIV